MLWYLRCLVQLVQSVLRWKSAGSSTPVPVLVAGQNIKNKSGLFHLQKLQPSDSFSFSKFPEQAGNSDENNIATASSL